MQIKIYQAYYKPEQISSLDPNFTPYDNSAYTGDRSLSEYTIYKAISKLAKQENLDLWGHFSWQYSTKLQNTSSQQILDYINQNTGYDVYHYNAFPQEVAVQYNVWEQGQWCHPHMIDIANELLPHMMIDAETIKKPMGIREYCMANYVVGNAKFWDSWLNFIDIYLEAEKKLSSDTYEKLFSSAEYPYNTGLNYRGFVIERLLSTYFLLNPQNLRIKPYIDVYNRQLNNNQKQMIVDKTQNTSKWLATRPIYSGCKDWASEWCAK